MIHFVGWISGNLRTCRPNPNPKPNPKPNYLVQIIFDNADTNPNSSPNTNPTGSDNHKWEGGIGSDWLGKWYLISLMTLSRVTLTLSETLILIITLILILTLTTYSRP